MADVIARNLPTYYDPTRLAFQYNDSGELVLMIDMRILNGDGEVIDGDHPGRELTTGEATVFVPWAAGVLDEYEDYTETLGRRLVRWVPPAPQEP